ncbi:EAL domain-containing protein [Halioglobus maricola]|uniref:cyclic-guanylate-specific phosphodiesterase n=1 Tax=Halioglobus maricola TaxID=2601894 RepID=A0A5P9NJ90_9GAMM|nr:EAL domain-containing protein [Halioglobus maricola]QFU75038.1 EAL domain-containing protein [Halioglobus maricola]
MSIAGKFNALVISIVVSVGLLVCGLTSVREYRAERDRVFGELEQQVNGRHQIAYGLYRSNPSAVRSAVQPLLQSPVASIAVFTAQGSQVLALGSTEVLPTLPEARPGAASADISVLSLGAEGQSASSGLLGAFFPPGAAFHINVPAYAGVSPLDEVTPEAFVLAQSEAAVGSSRHVMGYIHFVVPQRTLLQQLLPQLTSILLACGLFGIVSIAFSAALTRRITAPLERLARAADDLAAGKLEKPVQTRGSGEIQDIARIINSVFSGMSEYKTQMDVDHQLLSMKVEERTAQLSKRNKELNKAVKQVTQVKNRLRQFAYYDSLTALPNRRLFTEQLSLLLRLAKRNEEQLALLFLDLDNFKRINDSLGHSAGDLLLREVGARLANCVRESDVVAHYSEANGKIGVSRLGGDEFTVVLNHVAGPEAAGVVAQRLLDALIEPMLIDGHELVVTPSVGIALAPDHAEDVEGLLRCADTAMYHAKAAGKNSYLIYDSEMDAAGLDRLTLETDLRRAMERDELVLYYQPQVNTRTGAVEGAEALMRWMHPEQGLIPPFRFIPLAEEMGLIGEMGDWAIREACMQVQRFREQGLVLPRVAVNVSALQFTPSFVRKVKDILEETAVDPSVLQLELTEGVVMGDTHASVNALSELREMGVSLSIDDFGTGYSSLSYLSRFPLTELKIDRSFVIAADKSEEDASLVIAIIAMARGLGLDVVAEGVETSEQYHFISEHGGTVIQGYLFSAPVPVDEFADLLRPWHFVRQLQDLDGNARQMPG